MLLERIEKDFKKSLIKKQAENLRVLRMLKTELHNKEINLRRHITTKETTKESKPVLTDSMIIEIIQKEVKKRKEAIELFKRGKRDDLANKEEGELKILSQYLPKQLADNKIGEIVDKVIRKIKASGPSDFGKIMSEVMPQVKGKADGTKVSQIVREKLLNK